MVHYKEKEEEPPMEWWVELGFFAFKAGEDGNPEIGEVIKRYREEAGISQKALADMLKVHKSTVKNMENRKIRIDMDRRKFLSEKLGIPGILLGFITPVEIDILLADRRRKNKRRMPPGGSGSGGASLIEAKETYLAYVNNLSRYETAIPLIDTTIMHMTELHGEFLYVSRNKQREICELLYKYHIQLSCDWRNLQQYDLSIFQLDQAEHLAERLNDNEFRMITLLKRGRVFDCAERYQEALEAYQKAQILSRKVPDYLNGICLVYMGPILARLAMTETDKRMARTTIKQGGEIVQRQGRQIYTAGLDSSMQRFYLDLADTYCKIGWNKEAIDTLDFVQYKQGSWWQIHRNLIEAEAHANRKEYDFATDCLLENTRISKMFKSPMRLAQHRSLYNQLDYDGTNRADLGRMLGGS